MAIFMSWILLRVRVCSLRCCCLPLHCAATRLGQGKKSVFSKGTSLIFKNTRVIRMFDAKRNTLVYVAIGKRVIEGSPMNAISAVPISPWTGR